MTTLDLSRPHVLRSVEEYDLAAGEILVLLDRHPEPGSDDYDRLELLTVLIQAYDAEYVRFGEDADITPQQIVVQSGGRWLHARTKNRLGNGTRERRTLYLSSRTNERSE